MDHGGVEGSRSGGLCAFCLGLPQLPGPQRLPRGSATLAERAERRDPAQAAFADPRTGDAAQARPGPGQKVADGREKIMTPSVADARFMARALQLARRGMNTTDPNPRVGCVIVKDGKIIGEGWHERAGEPHAEVNALNQAGKIQAHSAGVYLTLEPCCHQGRTPPCTQALIKAGVTRVVAAMRDPNPHVAGKGFKELEQQ